MATDDASNIKVYVRCRNRPSTSDAEQCPYTAVSSKEIIRKSDPSKRYEFDHIFNADTTQNGIFKECAEPLVDELIRGYNGTLFAYGQTGTGKTYTMTGDCVPSMDSERAGIVPRVLESVFSKLEASHQDWVLELKYVELYNEDLRDLLSQQAIAKDRPSAGGNSRSHTKQLRIVEGRNKSIEVLGAISVPVTNLQSALEIVRDATSRRQTACTKLNMDSSRSHTVLSLILVSNEPVSGMAVRSKLHLVDLAGSENVAKSGAVKLRAQEAGEINKSLLSLGRVIEMLVSSEASATKSSPSIVRDSSNTSNSRRPKAHASKGKPYVSYRDSKLTHLLQDSLGGSTKTRMIATISLAQCDIEETKSTLEYASRARSIRNQIQTEVEITDMQITLKGLAKQLEDTQQELRIQRSRDGGVFLTNYNYHQLKSDQRKYAELLAQKETELKHRELEVQAVRSENAKLILDRDTLKGQVMDFMEKSQRYGIVSESNSRINKTTESVLESFTQYSKNIEKISQMFHEKFERLPKELESIGLKLQESLNGGASHISSATNTLHARTREVIERQSETLKEDIRTQLAQINESVALSVSDIVREAKDTISVLKKSLADAGNVSSNLRRQFDNLQADIAMQQNTNSESIKLVSLLEAHELDYKNTVTRLEAKRRHIINDLVGKLQQAAVSKLSNGASNAIDLVSGIHDIVSKCDISDTLDPKRVSLPSGTVENISKLIDGNMGQASHIVSNCINEAANSCTESFTAQQSKQDQIITEHTAHLLQDLKYSAPSVESTQASALNMKALIFDGLKGVLQISKSSDEPLQSGGVRPPSSPQKGPIIYNSERPLGNAHDSSTIRNAHSDPLLNQKAPSLRNGVSRNPLHPILPANLPQEDEHAATDYRSASFQKQISVSNLNSGKSSKSPKKRAARDILPTLNKKIRKIPW